MAGKLLLGQVIGDSSAIWGSSARSISKGIVLSSLRFEVMGAHGRKAVKTWGKPAFFEQDAFALLSLLMVARVPVTANVGPGESGRSTLRPYSVFREDP